MRLLHTADWHLGRVFHGHSLLSDQAVLLDRFVTMVGDSRPDAVLISGDLFDRSVPPGDAVRLLDDTLTRIVASHGVPVIAISGNHDGTDRLAFGSRLMSGSGLCMQAVPTVPPSITVINDHCGAVDVFALPYTEPASMRYLLGDGVEIADHQAVLAAQMAGVRARRNAGNRLIVMAHAFVAGGSDCESERPLAVGGSSSVSPAVFDDADYVALGHLHRPQSVGRSTIRYAGSLMKYSFSEVTHCKSVSLVELDADGLASIEELPLDPLRDLRIIEGSLAEVLMQAPDDQARNDYLMFRLTDTGALLDAMGRLRAAYPNALAIERVSGAQAAHRPGASTTDHRQTDLLDLFGAFAQEINGSALDATDRQLIAQESDALAHAQRRSQS